jgi:prepilin-type N-terminal cleavage/methylation domain-containing protein
MRSVWTKGQGFTLIELLVVIALIAILAAILFPVFAQVRERARQSACSSNMRQLGSALMMYVQDYDETFPHIRFHGIIGAPRSSDKGDRTYCWKNAIAPYLKSIDVFACPSNPFSRSIPGAPASVPPKPGANAEGWEVESGQRMPISYAMNSCAHTFPPAEEKSTPPATRLAQIARPADTILICENQWPFAGTDPYELWNYCPDVFAHPAGKVGNFIFHDGHVQAKKWLATLYPVSANNWEPGQPSQDPNNRKLNGFWPCQYPVPSGPEAKEFQTKDCLAYQ